MKQEEIKAKQAEILNLIANGYSQKEAFTKTGVAERTFYDWMKNPQFMQEVHNAQKTARINKADVRAVERSLLDIAKGFEYEEVKISGSYAYGMYLEGDGTDYNYKMNLENGQWVVRSGGTGVNWWSGRTQKTFDFLPINDMRTFEFVIEDYPYPS